MQNSHLQSDPCQTCLSDRSRLQIPPRGQPPGCWIEIFHSVLPFHCQHKHWSHRCVLLMTWFLIIIVNLVVFSSSDLMCQHGSLCPRMATVWKGSRPSSMKARATDKTLRRRKLFFKDSQEEAKDLSVIFCPSPDQLFSRLSPLLQSTTIRQTVDLEKYGNHYFALFSISGILDMPPPRSRTL